MEQGIAELKEFMKNDITDNDRMILFLNKLTEFNEHTKVAQMKEQIKMFGAAAEIFEDALVPFMNKILSQLLK